MSLPPTCFRTGRKQGGGGKLKFDQNTPKIFAPSARKPQDNDATLIREASLRMVSEPDTKDEESKSLSRGLISCEFGQISDLLTHLSCEIDGFYCADQKINIFREPQAR